MSGGRIFTGYGKRDEFRASIPVSVSESGFHAVIRVVYLNGIHL